MSSRLYFRLAVLAFLVVLVGGAIIAKVVRGNHFGGAYGLIMPTFEDGTISFENGTYQAQAYADAGHKGLLQFSGRYTQVGNGLHLTFESVTDDQTGLEKIKGDLLQGDVETMNYMKSADFLMKRGDDGRIELYSNGDNMGPRGELNMILVNGAADSISSYSVVMHWPAAPGKPDASNQTPVAGEVTAPTTNEVTQTPAPPAAPQTDQASNEPDQSQAADNSQPDQSQQDQSQGDQSQSAPDQPAPDNQSPSQNSQGQ